MVEVWRVRLEEDFRETEYTVVCLSVCMRVGRDQVCAWEGKSGGEKRGRLRSRPLKNPPSGAIQSRLSSP